jgi:hypothetical protein
MIFIKAIKFLLLEQCVDVFFNQLQKNFNVIKETDLPKEGDTFSRIVSKDKTEIYYNCRIMEIYPTEDEKDLYVDFEYTHQDFFDEFGNTENDRESVEEILNSNIFDDDDDEFDIETIVFSEYIFYK